MLRKTLDRQWIGGIERRDPSADILCHLLAAHVEQAVNEAFRRLVERLVAIDRIGERLRIAGSLECSNAEFVGSAKVAPRQLRVFFLQSDQPQVHMGIEEVGAFGKQPDEFVPGDLRFTRLHHRLHLLHVGPPPAGTSGVHKFPYRAGRGLVLFEGEFFSHGSLFPDHSRLCVWNPRKTRLQGARVKKAGKVAGRRRAVKVVHETAVVVRRGARVLVVQRGPGEWWEGLWDFPRLPGGMRSVRRGIERSELLGGLSCGATERLGKIAHSVTHHRITLDVVSCTAGRIGPAMRCRRWVTATALELLAMTSPGRRIARLVLPVSKRTPT